MAFPDELFLICSSSYGVRCSNMAFSDEFFLICSSSYGVRCSHMDFPDELFLICSSSETICEKKKALEMFFLCATWHIFPLKLLREKNKRLGQISHGKSEIGITLSPRIFRYTLKRKRCLEKLQGLKSLEVA